MFGQFFNSKYPAFSQNISSPAHSVPSVATVRRGALCFSWKVYFLSKLKAGLQMLDQGRDILAVSRLPSSSIVFPLLAGCPGFDLRSL